MSLSDPETVIPSRGPTKDQIVLHLDMDCFFAACERLRRPELEGEPVVIGGGFESEPPRGAVATASYEAREYGVHSAQPISEALRKLPRRSESDGVEGQTGIYLKGDHSYYREVSSEVMEIVEEYANTTRRISIDEAYLDITDETTWQNAGRYATDLKSQISQEVGVVASIGLAPTMSCAKIASDYNKPDGLCVVGPNEVQSFLAPMDIGDIHGVGPVRAKSFKEKGIETAGDLASLSTQEVLDRFGSNTTTLYDRVRGVDPREVEPVGKRKSISKEKSIEPTSSRQIKEATIQTLADRVHQRAISEGVHYRTVGVKVVETPFDRQTRERSLMGPIQNDDLLKEVAQSLLEDFSEATVRKLGVKVSRLDFFNGDQTQVSDWTSGMSSRTHFSTPNLGQSRLNDFSV